LTTEHVIEFRHDAAHMMKRPAAMLCNIATSLTRNMEVTQCYRLPLSLSENPIRQQPNEPAATGPASAKAWRRRWRDGLPAKRDAAPVTVDLGKRSAENSALAAKTTNKNNDDLGDHAENSAPLAAFHAAPIAARVTIMPPRRPAPWTSAVLVIIALAIAALALTINGQTGWRFGTTPLAAVTFTGLALAADLLAIILPAAAVALWHAGRGGLAASAWMTWIVAASLATLASLGFVELHTADTAAGRAAIVTTATLTADQRTAAITAAQLALATATRQREAECQRRGPLCRDREADERTALATLNTAIATPVPAAATIATADPQVTAVRRLTTWAGLNLTAVDVVNLRLVLMAMLLNIAGLVLMFGVALAFPASRRAAT
jgi:hypothetical protein